MKARAASKRQKHKKLADRACDLEVYVVDQTPTSVAALSNLKRMSHEHLEDKCRISVIDIEKYPQLARENHIVAIPTLVISYPPSAKRLIGDLSNTKRVLAELSLPLMD